MRAPLKQRAPIAQGRAFSTSRLPHRNRVVSSCDCPRFFARKSSLGRITAKQRWFVRPGPPWRRNSPPRPLGSSMELKKVPLVREYEIEALSDDYPRRSRLSRISHKMAWALPRGLTRRLVMFVAICFGIVYFMQRHRTFDALVNYTYTYSNRPCYSNRTNPHNVSPPPDLDRQYIDALWNSLYKNFDTNRPHPDKLEKPKHENYGFPPEVKVGSFFNITAEEANESLHAHERVVENLPDYPVGKFRGRGIVMLAGGRYSEYAATSLGVLREVGSQLPVEVWYKDEKDETPGWCAELLTEGMVCRRLSDYLNFDALGHRMGHPYQWKVFTLLFSSFSEILFLDADSMPIKNPDFIFDTEPYHRTGAIMWPDYWRNSASPWATYITKITKDPDDKIQEERSVESGQLVWDKERLWKPLLLAAYYNFWGRYFYYTMFNNGYAGWGDKDTFPFALRAFQKPFHMASPDIGTGFVNGKGLGIGMIQADPRYPSGQSPLFMHSNIVKWSVRGFFCDEKCPEVGATKYKNSHSTRPDSPIIKLLAEGTRIYDQSNLRKIEMDLEPTMWKAMEHTACRGVPWSNEALCERTRAYMQKTFGFRFVGRRGSSKAVGPTQRVCMIPPS